jgi:hypothetical protein
MNRQLAGRRRRQPVADARDSGIHPSHMRRQPRAPRRCGEGHTLVAQKPPRSMRLAAELARRLVIRKPESTKRCRRRGSRLWPRTRSGAMTGATASARSPLARAGTASPAVPPARPPWNTVPASGVDLA